MEPALDDPSVDEITAGPPTSPTYREGVSLWAWDDAGRFAFPRIGVEAVGASWETSFGTALCLARPDGQLLIVTGDHPPLPVADPRGAPRVLGAGPLRFECVEPFERWRIDFDGEVVVTTVDAYVGSGNARIPLAEGQARVGMRLHLDARMTAPPWSQGTHDPDGEHVAGEERYEQLCRVTGTVAIDGVESTLAGGGLRIHRKGGARNDYGDFYGHNWQSARFPSGRAFGFVHYRPRPDGSTKYREGWLLDGDTVVPAKVERTSWMTSTRPTGEDVSFELRTAGGDVVRIEGETYASAIRPPRPIAGSTPFPVLQSGVARYRWDGEEAFGMVERSMLPLVKE